MTDNSNHPNLDSMTLKVRDAFVTGALASRGFDRPRLGEEHWEKNVQAEERRFDQWFAEVQAQALDTAAMALDCLQTREERLPAEVRRDPALWLNDRADEIREAVRRG